jgi:hypothetical protein
MDIEVGGAKGRWFAPDFADNRKKPFEEQARFLCKPQTGRDKLKLDHANIIKTKADRKIKDLMGSVAKREWEKQKIALEASVIELANWNRYDKDKNERSAITEMKDFIEVMLAAANPDLFFDILDQTYAFIKDMSDVDEDQASE